MVRTPIELPEENSEQRDDGQAHELGEEAAARALQGADGSDRDPTSETEHGGTRNPAAVMPDDVPDLVDTMNQMVTSGRIDNSAFAGEPMMDDDDYELGENDDEVDPEDKLVETDEN